MCLTNMMALKTSRQSEWVWIYTCEWYWWEMGVFGLSFRFHFGGNEEGIPWDFLLSVKWPNHIL